MDSSIALALGTYYTRESHSLLERAGIELFL